MRTEWQWVRNGKHGGNSGSNLEKSRLVVREKWQFDRDKQKKVRNANLVFFFFFFLFFSENSIKKKRKIILNDGDDARAILWKATYENLFNNIFSRETCLMRDLQLTRWKMEHVKVIKSIHFTINHLIWYTIKFSLSSSTFKAVSCIEFDNSFRDRWEERKYGKMGWKQTDVKGNRIRRGEYRTDVYWEECRGVTNGAMMRRAIQAAVKWNCYRYAMRYGRRTQRSRQVLSRTTTCLRLRSLFYYSLSIPGTIATVFKARRTRNVLRAARLPRSMPIVT